MKEKVTIAEVREIAESLGFIYQASSKAEYMKA